uniref:Leucine-rich repeat-containing protein 53-like n=1 Tax=Drosophila rhopaloa TaxID=1041015 RepID=A0A6P4F959_DRORH
MEMKNIYVLLGFLTLAFCPTIYFECGCFISGSINGFPKANCKRSDIDIKCLSHQELETLGLSGNRLNETILSKLNSTEFEKLEHLDLSNNMITRLSSFKFNTMPRLQSVNLSHNLLTEMPGDPCRIPFIDVSHNNLTDMHSLVVLFRTNAITKGNPFLCNCSSPTVKRLYTTASHSKLKNIECILHDSDQPKPLSTQCHKEIEQNQTSLLESIILYCIQYFNSITLFFLIMFVIGVVLLCKKIK